MKKIIIILMQFVLFLSLQPCWAGYTITAEDEAMAKEAFVALPNPGPIFELRSEQSNAVVIKLKDGADPQEIFRLAGIESFSIEEITMNLPAGNLTATNDNNTLAQGKSQDGWYWYLGKEYKGSKSAASEEKISLGYRVALTQGVTAGQAIDKLRGNDQVEYIMPMNFASGIEKM
jgi:hypothetical protein